MKDFWRSQTVTYTAKELISCKQCKIGTLLLRPPIRSDIWPIKSRHFRWPWMIFRVIRLSQTFSNVRQLTTVQLIRASRGPSAIGKPLGVGDEVTVWSHTHTHTHTADWLHYTAVIAVARPNVVRRDELKYPSYEHRKSQIPLRYLVRNWFELDTVMEFGF